MAKPGTTWDSNDGKFDNKDRFVVEQYDLAQMLRESDTSSSMTESEYSDLAGAILTEVNKYLEFFKSVSKPDLSIKKY